MQERAEIQNMIVVQHWSLVELRKLYHLAELEGKEGSPGHSPLSQSPSTFINDPPPRYDDIQATNGNLKLSIEAPQKVEDKSQAMVKYQEKPLQQLDQSLQSALSKENQALQAPVHDIVDHLLHQWTVSPATSTRSSPSDRKHRPYYESDTDTTTDSEFERSEKIGGRHIEGPHHRPKKNVHFHARVESGEDESDGDRQRKRPPRRHILHSETDTSTDSEPSPAPQQRRSSDSTHAKYTPTQQEPGDRNRRPYTAGGQGAGREIPSARPTSRGIPPSPMPMAPRPIPHPNQSWPGLPPPPNLRPPSYYGSSPGGPLRMPPGGQYVPPQYMGHSPQPPPGNYFPGGQVQPTAPNPQRGPPRPRRHRTESRQKTQRDKDKESSSSNIKKGLFGGAAVAGILDILQGLDSL